MDPATIKANIKAVNEAKKSIGMAIMSKDKEAHVAAKAAYHAAMADMQAASRTLRQEALAAAKK